MSPHSSRKWVRISAAIVLAAMAEANLSDRSLEPILERAYAALETGMLAEPTVVCCSGCLIQNSERL